MENNNIEQPEFNINPEVNQNLKQLLNIIKHYRKNILYIYADNNTCYYIDEHTINIIMGNNYKNIEIIFKSNRSFLYNRIFNILSEYEQDGQLSYLEIKKNENGPSIKFCFL